MTVKASAAWRVWLAFVALSVATRATRAASRLAPAEIEAAFQRAEHLAALDDDLDERAREAGL